MLTLAHVISPAVPTLRRLRTVELEEVGCLHCGAFDANRVTAAADRFTAAGSAFQIVSCRQCRLAYTNPRPTEGSIAQFYPADYDCHEIKLRTSRSWRAKWRAQLESAVLRTYYGYPPQSTKMALKLAGWVGRAAIRRPHRRTEWLPFRGEGRLLDFGCGAGGFLERMRTRGWHVEGLDVSAGVAQAVQSQKGIRVHVGTLPHPDLAPGTFDAITIWQTLEHVHKPRQALRAAGALLRPGGLLLVMVPNFGGWSSVRFGPHWFGLDLPRHLTHFTQQTLRAMLLEEGFDLLKLETIGTDGWIRQSARRAAAAGMHGVGHYSWKPLALSVARWTEQVGRGDCILALAEPKVA